MFDLKCFTFLIWFQSIVKLINYWNKKIKYYDENLRVYEW